MSFAKARSNTSRRRHVAPEEGTYCKHRYASAGIQYAASPPRFRVFMIRVLSTASFKPIPNTSMSLLVSRPLSREELCDETELAGAFFCCPRFPRASHALWENLFKKLPAFIPSAMNSSLPFFSLPNRPPSCEVDRCAPPLGLGNGGGHFSSTGDAGTTRGRAYDCEWIEDEGDLDGLRSEVALALFDREYLWRSALLVETLSGGAPNSAMRWMVAPVLAALGAMAGCLPAAGEGTAEAACEAGGESGCFGGMGGGVGALWTGLRRISSWASATWARVAAVVLWPPLDGAACEAADAAGVLLALGEAMVAQQCQDAGEECVQSGLETCRLLAATTARPQSRYARWSVPAPGDAYVGAVGRV